MRKCLFFKPKLYFYEGAVDTLNNTEDLYVPLNTSNSTNIMAGINKKSLLFEG